MSPGASFSLQDAQVNFGAIRALGPLSLDIPGGDLVAFIGPSGAGKTTLLRLLNASLRPSGGWVCVDGRPARDYVAADLRALRRRLGFVHQDLSLVPSLRVVQNVIAGRLGHWSFPRSARAMLWPPEALVEEVYAILERVGIPEKLYERTDRLSGGQRQRVAIARAMFQGPDAILADEPVSSVDPARARDTVALLTDICREKGLTLCMSLHNFDLARGLFPRLVGLRSGDLAFDLPADEVDSQRFDALYDLGESTQAGSHG